MQLKRKTAALLLSAALAASLLAGCAVKDTSQADAPQQGDIISDAVSVVNDSEVTTFGLSYQSKFGLNPYSCTSLTNRTIQSLLYESLFTVTSSFDVEPLLCQYYDVSEDLKTYTIHLIDGVSFWDGGTLRASDVVASFNAARGSDVYGSRFYNLTSLNAPDEQTVVFTMSQPYENLPLLLDIPIVSSDTVSQSTPIGTGPYRLVSEENKSILVRNTDWWQDAYDASVTVSTISLVETATPTDVRDDFEYGVTGVVCTDPNSAAYVDYHCDYELWNCSTTIMDYVGFNVAKGLFSSPALRTALTYIIDRDTITTELYKGFAEAASLPVSPMSNFYDPALAADYAYDPARFRAAVLDAGAKDASTKILVSNADPRRVNAAEFIAASATDAGLNMTVETVSEKQYQQRLKNGNFELYLGEARLAPNFDLAAFFNGGSLCYGGIYSGNLSTLSTDALENSGNYYNLHAAVMDNGYLCPVLFKNYAVYATRGVIANMYPAIDNVFHTSNGRTLSDAILADPEAEPAGDSESGADEEEQPAQADE